MILGEAITGQLYFWSFKGLLFIFVLLVTWLAGRFVRFFIGRIFKKPFPYFYASLREYGKWITWLAGFLVALATLGLSSEILLITILLLGSGLILATKDALQNLFARPFIDIYSEYKTGDWMRIGDIGGRVIEINALNTILITKAGDMAIVPNHLFLKNIMINESYQAGYELTIPIMIDKEIDEMELEKGVIKVAEGQNRYLKPGVSPSVITIKSDNNSKELALILVLKDRQDKKIVIEAINDGVKKLLDEI